MRYEPRLYQKRAIRALLEHPHFGLFLDPGLGKTSTTLAALRVLRARGFVRSALVIAPLRVAYEVWPRELAKWDEFRGLTHRVLHGKTRTLEGEPVDLYVINPEGLGWLFTELHRRGGPWPFDWLVLDESTRFKHTNTQRFRLLKNHLARFARRTILTGTPTPNGLLDLFGQLYCVDLGRALGRYVTHYRNEFFTQSGWGGYEWKPQPDAEARIRARIASVTLSMAADDWLEMPRLVENDVYVDLPEAARRQYRELERELVLELERGDVVAANAAVASMKCRQLANGGLYVDGAGGRATQHLHEAKVDALESIVEELQGAPLLVAYEFAHDLERLRARFGEKTPALHGGMAPAAVRAIVDAWNAGRLPLLLAQPQTVAHGLNLQEAGNAVAWFGLTWDAEVYRQFVQRVWRSGQRAAHVIVHHLVARGTVDEDVLAAVRGKERSQRALLNALKARLSTPGRR